MSLALARKYRPRTFADVAVQSHVSNTLKGAIARGRVAHGYLFCGPRGTGKTTLARVLAMALNCERRLAAVRAGEPDSGEPCGECTSCTRIWSGAASLDVVEIDAASNRGVDDARELRERAMYAPSGDDRYKVYIVDEAHMLTREAWNALLKVLEEPPPRVVFAFATTEPQKIAQAAAPVLSRLQRFDLKRIGPAEIRERLASVLASEKVSFEPEALAMIARAADGGLRDALSLTDQVLSLGAASEVTADRVREALGLVAEDEYLGVLDLVAERRAADAFSTVGRLADLGVDLGGFLTGLADALRAQLAVVLGGTPPDTSERFRAALEERRDALGASDLLRMLHALGELEPRFRKSAQQQLLLETLLVRFALMDRSVALEDVLRGLGGASGPTDGGTPPRTPPSGGRASFEAMRDALAPGPRASGEITAPTPRRPGAAAAAAPPQRETRSAPIAYAPPAAPAAPLPAAPRSAARPATPPADEHAPLDPPEDVIVAREAARGSSRAPAGSLDLHRVLDAWDAVVDDVRASGARILATFLDDATPVGASAAGMVTIEVTDPTAVDGIEKYREALLAALRTRVGGAERVQVRLAGGRAESPAARRLTSDGVKAERLAMLRKRDPLLDAAVDALDLELLD